MDKPVKKLRVWNGDTFIRLEGANKREQMHVVVAAYSKAQAVRMIPEMTINEFNNYWSETGNDKALALATEVGVWVTGYTRKRDDNFEPVLIG